MTVVDPHPREAAAQPVLLRRIVVRNLLSFGPEGVDLELGPLNVLIGPNGSGKSNLLSAISLLRATPTDLSLFFRQEGAVDDWIWKGNPLGIATLEVDLWRSTGSIHHRIAISNLHGHLAFIDERIDPDTLAGQIPSSYHYASGSPVFVAFDGSRRQLPLGSLQWDQSVLYQVRDPFQFPTLSSVEASYRAIALFREWQLGRRAAVRDRQPADLPNSFLIEDLSNLALFLNRIRANPKAKAALLEHLQALYDGLDDFDVRVEGGTLQIYFTEGDFTVPAMRLSDGSLRFLCLLAILYDPTPPALICIEEPELGLHPDLLHKLADLLVDASQRCQIIVTTHSDILVDALSEVPEAVVVCEKSDGQSTMRRLDPIALTPWLEKYRLGRLWSSGHLGGNRW